MATKFGYVERNLENDVNWANVGKGFSDMLLAERDERAAKKGALDDAMQETQEGLRNNAPIGYNTDFNDRMIGLAANSNAFVLAANKDLKAGRITPEDYMRKLNRVNSSADTTFALANNYNAIYEDKLKRMDAKDSGNVEQAAFEAMSKLVDFNKHDFMIDENGTIVAAPLITDENGVTRLDTDNARSVQAIFNLAQNNVDRFDVEGVVAESVQKLGKIVLGTSVAATYTKQGMDVLIEGIKAARPDKYKEWKEQQIARMMVDKLDVASILTDYSSESTDYETTTDKKEWLANKDKFIYVDIENGKEILIGELTEKQKEDAMNILDGVIESQVGSSEIEKATAKKEYSANELETFQRMNGKTEAKKTIATYWNQLGWGTAEQKQSAIESLMSNSYVRDGGLFGIEPNKDGTVLNFLYDGGRKSRAIDLTKNYTPEEWASIGAEVHGEDNAKKAMAAGGGWKKDIAFTTSSTGKWGVKGVIRSGVTEDRGNAENKRVIIAEYDAAIKNKIKAGNTQSIVDALIGAGLPSQLNEEGGVTAEVDGSIVNLNPTTESGLAAIRNLIRNVVGNDANKMKNFTSGTTSGTPEVATSGGSTSKYTKSSKSKSKETFDEIYSRVKDRAEAIKIFENQ
jgi:hypothetical protein